MQHNIDFEDPAIVSKLIVTMIEKTPVPTLVLDRQFHIRFANDSFLKLRKTTGDEVLGMRCFDLANQGVQCDICAVGDAMRSGKKQHILIKDVLSDGTVIFVDDQAIPLTDERGRYEYILEIMLDRSPVMRLREEANRVFVKIVDTLVSVLEKKDRYTSHHSTDVCTISRKLAMFAGMTPEEVDNVTLAALLHDVGKLHIPDAIINKPGRLTDEEFAVVKGHPAQSFALIQNLDSFDAIKHIVLAHHERWDGGGYPSGLRGGEAPREAYVVGIADAYDAMTSDRSYRKGMPHEAALDQIRANLGKQFDPDLGRNFLSLASLFLPDRESLVSRDEQVVHNYLSQKRREHKVTRIIKPADRKTTRVYSAMSGIDTSLIPLIFKHTPALYCLVDSGFRVLYASEQMASALGYESRHAMQGTTCTRSPTGSVACSPECKDGDCPAARAFRTGEMQTGTFMKTLDGVRKYFDMYALPLSIDDRNGDEIKCVMEILFDRTEETELRQKLERDIEALLVTLEELIVQLSPEATTNADAIIKECGSFSEFLEQMSKRYGSGA